VERAQGRLVGHVHPDPRLLRLAEDARVHARIVGRREDEGEAGGVARPVAAAPELDRPALLELLEPRHDLRRDHLRDRPLGEHALRLAERDLAPAHHEDALPAQAQHDRVHEASSRLRRP